MKEFNNVPRAVPRAPRVNLAFLIRLKDVPKWEFTFYKNISTQEGFNEEIEKSLQQLSRIFTDYKISLIHIRGVEVKKMGSGMTNFLFLVSDPV